MDATTLITETAAPLPKAAERREVFANRARLLPARRLTRAHLVATQRPVAMSAMTEAAARVAAHLGEQLKSSVSCEATLLPSTLHPLTHLAGRALFVTLELGGESLALLELDALGVGALIATITGVNELVSLPTRLSNIEEAALAWVVLATLAELRKEPSFSSFSPRLISMTLDRSEALAVLDARRRHLGVQLALTIGQTQSLLRVLVPANWAQARLDALATESAPEMNDALGAATLGATCLIGTAVLPRADLHTLAAGDVILFSGVDRKTEGLTGTGRLVTDTFELHGTFTTDGFTLTRAFERSLQEHTMSNVDPSLPVEVEIELTRVRVPLHQLGAIRPGGLIPLHINATPHVVVRIGDKSVARAELVEIEGEIGARIVAML